MKLLFKLLIATLCVSSAYASEQINILWGFAIGSNQANTVRIMCQELNEMQDKYTFVLISKPGNSGTIAAQTVTTHPGNTLVGMGTSFITRPYFSKNEISHNLDDYEPILVQATDSPLYIFSSKYSTMDELLKAKNVNIGVSGIGALAHLTTIQLMEINPNIRPINYNSMIESATAAAGGHIDAMIGFYADAKSLVDVGKLKVLAHTGTKDKFNSGTKSITEFGLSETRNITASYAIYASKQMPHDKFVEIHNLLYEVNHHPEVLKSYQRDQLIPINLTIEQGNNWYSDQRKFWEKEMVKIKRNSPDSN